MDLHFYIHPKLGEEITAISGHYSIEKEKFIEYKSRRVYYNTGYSMFDTSCCGAGGCGFATVIGYSKNWKGTKNEAGLDISEVEPITDETERKEIGKLIMALEKVQQVNFWLPATEKH